MTRAPTLLPLLLASLAACGPWTDSAGSGAGATEQLHDNTTEGRVVSLGPSITEAVLAIDADRLVGTCAASTLPGAEALPKVGYTRAVSAEGVLSLAPDLVLADPTAGPPEVLDQIRAAGVAVEIVDTDRSLHGIGERLRAVAGYLSAEAAVPELVTSLEASCATLPEPGDGPSALFVYARGAGSLHVSGTDTAGHDLLGLAGLSNPITAYAGYRPLTAEAAVAADPDWLVFTERGLEAVGGAGALSDVPGLGGLEAVAEGRIATVNDVELLTFGLEICDGARALRDAVDR